MTKLGRYATATAGALSLLFSGVTAAYAADIEGDPSPPVDPAAVVIEQPADDEAPGGDFSQTDAALRDAPAPQDIDDNISLDFVLGRFGSSPETQSALSTYIYQGTLTCKVTAGNTGCKDLEMFLPVPDVDLPEGSRPLGYAISAVGWGSQLDQKYGYPTEDHTGWQYTLPDLEPGQQQEIYLYLENETDYQPSTMTFAVQPTISGSNFASVTSDPVTYTGTLPEPDVEMSANPNYGTAYAGSEISYAMSISGDTGWGGSGAAMAPESGTFVIDLASTPFQFVSASSDDEGVIEGTYDAATNTVTYKDFGLTWQQFTAGDSLKFAPLVVKVPSDYELVSPYGDHITFSGKLTYKTIASTPQELEYTMANSGTTTIKDKLGYVSDAVHVQHPVGNRGFYTGTLPEFADPVTWQMQIGPLPAPISFESSWGVPCRTGTAPNVKIENNRQCAAENVAFTLQTLQLSDASDSEPATAVLTRADGTTTEIEVSSTPTEIDGDSPVISAVITGKVPADASRTITVGGVYNEGALDGTPAEGPEMVPGSSSQVYYANSTWWARAGIGEGTLLPETSLGANNNVAFSLSTGASIRVAAVDASSARFEFNRFTTDDAGQAQGAILLPPGLRYLGTLDNAGNEVEPAETLLNWNSTGQTLLRYDLPAKEAYNTMTVYWTAASADIYPLQAAITAGTNEFSGERCWRTSPNTWMGPTPTATSNSEYAGKWVSPGSTSGMLTDDSNGACYNDTRSAVITGTHGTIVSGKIKNTDQEVWTPSPGLQWKSGTIDGVEPGDKVDFMAQVKNASLETLTTPVSYVGIPQKGAKNPVEGTLLGTTFDMQLASAVTAPAGWTVAYSQSLTPCQPELGVDTACEDDWTTAPPADLSSVKFLRFNAASLYSGSVANFTYQLQVPSQSQICTDLGLADGCDYSSAVAWNLVTMGHEVDGTNLTSYSAETGIGSLNILGVYPNLTASVLSSDGHETGHAWAKAGDTVRFTQVLSIDPDDHGAAANPLLVISIPQLGDNLTYKDGSLKVNGETAQKEAVYSAVGKQIQWTASDLERTRTLTFDVVVGDGYVGEVSANTWVPSQANFEFATCEAGSTPWPCNLVATIGVPQLWVDTTTTPADGATIESGQSISYQAVIEAAGITAKNQSSLGATVTWDVSGLVDYGQIEAVKASSGLAAYNAGTKSITWKGMDLSQAKPTLNFVFKSDKDVPGDKDKKVDLKTSLTASVDESVNPVIPGTSEHPLDQTAWQTHHYLTQHEDETETQCTTGKVMIVGSAGQQMPTASFRDVLSAKVTGWETGTDLSYQWYVRDSASGQRWAINGATSSKLDLGATPAGVPNGLTVVERFVEVEVTGTSEDCNTQASSQRVHVSPIVNRFWGSNRYGTSASLNNRFGMVGGTVYVATGQTYPDALSVAPVVARENASLVLTMSKQLSPEARKTIASLRPSNIVIIGGESSVTPAVRTELEGFVGAAKVSRIGGVDRYETSMMLFNEKFAGKDLNRVYLASGYNFADALVAGPAAAKFHGPVVVIDAQNKNGRLTSAVHTVAANNPHEVVALGGTNTITPASFNLIRSALPSTVRVGGQDRYETAALINQVFGSPEEFVWMASGEVFADALTAGVPAGRYETPLYLARKSCVPASTAAAINRIRWGEMVIVGGPVTLEWGIEKLNTCK